MTKKQDKQTLLINGASIIAAPFTGGLSLIGLAVPFLFGGDDGEEDRRRREEERKERERQYQDMMKSHENALKERQNETDKLLKEIKDKNVEVERITAILNNPSSSEEEKKNARKKLVVLEDEIRADKKKVQALEKELEKMRNNPPQPPSIP